MKNWEYYWSRCDRRLRCEYIKSRMITTKAKEDRMEGQWDTDETW